jgi:hypothetical protein
MYRKLNLPIVGRWPGVPAATFISSGRYNQNQLIASVTARVNQNISLNGNYTLSRSPSNTDAQYFRDESLQHGW